MALVHLGSGYMSLNNPYNPHVYDDETDFYETRALAPDVLAAAVNELNGSLASDDSGVVSYTNADAMPARERVEALRQFLPKGSEFVRTGDDGSGFWRIRRNMLDLTDDEAKWEREHYDAAVAQARSNGDYEAANLRVMMNYANGGGVGARSLNDIREMAWKLRNSRDIRLAKKVADRLSEREGRDVHWTDVIVPTTVDMVRYRDAPRVMYDYRNGPVRVHDMSIAEALAADINEKAAEEGYRNLRTYNQAEYLASRYGLRPVTEEYQEVDPVRGGTTGRPVALATGRYEADPDRGRRDRYLTDRQAVEAAVAADLEGYYQNLVENRFSGRAPDPSVIWSQIAGETLTPKLYRDYPERARMYQDYLDRKLGRYVPPAPGAELADKWRTQWEWNPWNRPVSERDRRAKQERFRTRYKKVVR